MMRPEYSKRSTISDMYPENHKIHISRVNKKKSPFHVNLCFVKFIILFNIISIIFKNNMLPFVLLLPFHVFGINAADKTLLLETYVKHTSVCNIYIIGMFVKCVYIH